MKKKVKKQILRVFSVDWGVKNEREEWYDVIRQKILKDKPELIKRDIVLVENIPWYKAKKMFDKGIIILTCHTMATHDHRTKLGFPVLCKSALGIYRWENNVDMFNLSHI